MASGRRALELDPLSPSKYFIVGLTHFCLHEIDAAIAQFRKTLELDPNAFSAQELMTCAYALQGRYEEAIAACQTLSSLAGESAASRLILGYIHILSGNVAEAKNILEELQNLLEKDPLVLFYSPMVCAALGEFDRAFELLGKLCDIRFGPLFSIKGLPIYDPLRSDPRFKSVLRRMGLPE
jgi:tetratricopeptide (TPR) repeat protein